jgi:hypothetical protein
MALSSISVVLSSLSLRSRIPGLGFRVTTGEEIDPRNEKLLDFWTWSSLFWYSVMEVDSGVQGIAYVPNL